MIVRRLMASENGCSGLNVRGFATTQNFWVTTTLSNGILEFLKPPYHQHLDKKRIRLSDNLRVPFYVTVQYLEEAIDVHLHAS
ncbi:MAG: hypothetical protein Q9166_006269 [cf. Caloplaca sp. 2 TL-2023]